MILRRFQAIQQQYAISLLAMTTSFHYRVFDENGAAGWDLAVIVIDSAAY